MPTWPDLAAFSRDLDKLERDLARTEAQRITKLMADEAVQIGTKAASADLGGDPKFSGWAPRLDLDVRRTRGFGHIVQPNRRSAGPWTVAEQGRNQGDGGGGAFFGPGANRRDGSTRRRKDGSVAKVRAFRSKRWNGYTRGKNTASDAVSDMERRLPKIAEREVGRVVRRRFDVT